MKPTVSHFKVFGCVCYVFVPGYLRSKFEKRQPIVSLWAMMRTEKDGDIVILQLAKIMSHEMLYLMRHHHGGHQSMLHFLTLIK